MTWNEGQDQLGPPLGWYLYRPTPTHEPVKVRIHDVCRLKFVWEPAANRSYRLDDCHGEFLRPLERDEFPCDHAETRLIEVLSGPAPLFFCQECSSYFVRVIEYAWLLSAA